MKAIEELRQRLPDHSKDIKLNLQSVLTQSKLPLARLWGTAVACAIATRNAEVRDAVIADAQEAGLAEDVLDDARAAASLMGMNNVYYRFRHFMEDVEGADYGTMPARLRMNRIARPKGEKVDFELFCLAVSAINGCEMCVRSHEAVVVKGEVPREEVHDAVRLAATLQAAAIALEQG
ncbi:MAG TPA: carboxymuconolactone decarboxylase family protein [Polyangiaceae bacterium LLY-WYZ-15_(1-7)]|nr:alkyl hydroperoxide reductase [Sandaracinus sp.]HJK94350.1 carboxymuconolactone decarboxylase family protein [Polyangiaceae bacterium LLY-WYZ-15_(1-7)]MBJ74780.1 alkyl hydroperoxide reductase [Sandaracinus sp.]HJL02760.1 carboxymuconolactone decarboxylase family protein [Polyangiaceae bacterium LLY-WYZ-15_(1-7)]HJL09760.1 carboxymuconolactone decarboxylase family protein [Polyangiaceae bacterium LLY-WYZ-15_(1-7)]